MGINVGNNANNPNDEPEVMLDINTTPLIDVMLVLLIMLIITIPAQLHSLNMDMPVSSAPPTKKTEPVVVKLNVDANNQVTWNGKVVSRPDLVANLQAAKAQDPQPELHIRSDGKARYETVAGVLADIQRVGITKMGFVGIEAFDH